jgi:malate synthase
MSIIPRTEDVMIEAPVSAEYAEILTPEAIAFVVHLHRQFNERRLELLRKRAERQVRIDAGERPDFLPETAAIRDASWTVAPIPPISPIAAPKSPAPSTAR